MRIRNSAQLALAARRLAQTKQTRDVLTDQADTVANMPNGGFRAGKRKRGHSPLKQAPNQVARAITYYVIDADGNTVAKVKTLTNKGA